MEIVSALRHALADRVGNERFELWFGSGTRLELTDGSLVVVAPSPFLVEFLQTNFRGAIESACREILGKLPEIRFNVDKQSTEAETVDKQPTQTESRASQSTKTSHPNATLVDGARQARLGQGEKQPHAPSGSPGRNGWVKRRRFASLDTFVVGEGNRLAQAAACQVAERPGELSPLLIHGPTSVGKTHLLEGIWTAARKRNRANTVVYLTAEQFVNGFLQALRGSGLPSFRRKYRGVDLLILDDIQFFHGKKHTQIELFYTIDTLLREGRQLVLAGDRRPQQLCDLGAELSSRLASGMVCSIEPPDYSTRLGIATHMARRQRLKCSSEVLALVASRLTRHAREISGALCRLQATSEAWGKPITLSLAEEALADMITTSSPVVRLTDVEKAVCETFGLEPATLQSKSKARRVNHPRMLAMWLARKYTRSALSEIGHYFGRRSHSTVVSAQKRVDGWVSAKTTVELADQTWGVEEALREVEQCLRAG